MEMARVVKNCHNGTKRRLRKFEANDE